LISNSGDMPWNVDYGWRWMFGSALAPSLLFLICLFLVPETPRWLAKQGENEKALSVLSQVGGLEHAQQELTEILNTIQEESGSILQLLQPGFRRALVITLILAVTQQVTGINAIMYYAPIIFSKLGQGTNAALTGTVLVGTVN